MQPVGEPDVAVERSRVVVQSSNSCLFQWYWMLLELLVEALAEFGGFKGKLPLCASLGALNEQGLIDDRLIDQCRGGPGPLNAEGQPASADTLGLVPDRTTGGSDVTP